MDLNLNDVTRTLDLTPAQRTELDGLLARTNSENPSPADRELLRAYFERYPELWDFMGNIALLVRDKLITRAGRRAVINESTTFATDALHRSLMRPTDNALELLAIQECIITYLSHYLLQLRFLNLEDNARAAGHALGHADIEHWDKRLDRSQRQFLRALESLARIRNLGLPLLQINIAREQTNIAAAQANLAPAPVSDPPSALPPAR